jgi:hypothetical protein
MEFDYLKAFYSSQHDEGSLIEGIDSLLHTYNKLQAKVFPCYIDKRFFEALHERPGFRILSKKANITLFEYSRTIKSIKNPETLIGKFFTVANTDFENIYTVITIDDADFFSKGVINFFLNQYPRVSLTFVTHKKIHKLLTNFRDNNYLRDFKIIKASVKSRVEKKVISSVHWPEFTLEKAFEWVKDENGWFERLTIETKKETSEKFNVSISRDGIVKTNGFFNLSYTDFILPISKTVHENISLFGRRARLENKGEVKPLCIDYGYELFKTVDENKRFIDAMRKLKAASVSVIHGNPYVQLSIFDYFDGSSYDLWVLSIDKIIIVPQLKSSFQAIKRLINHIFDNYYEGSIKEYTYSNG